MKKGFDSELVYEEKYLNGKINFYEGKISTNVHDNGIPIICKYFQENVNTLSRKKR